jgi:hypothetical protein
MTKALATAAAIGLLAAIAALTPAGATADSAAGLPDTTPPDPYIRARSRQDIHDVFKHGIQTTCGTEDDERPVTCRMTALRKGRVLAVGTGRIEAPYNRFHFALHISNPDEARLRDADTPVAIKLLLRVTDPAGNVGKDRKRIRLVADLYGD